jgi:hypothetical protein
MSIGNIRTYGQKGSNMPFQLRVLEGIQTLVNSLTPSTSTSTAALLSSTTSGTINVATKSISFHNNDANNPAILNVNGGGNVNIPPGVTVNFDAGANAKYPAGHFVYDATGSSFIISYTY